MRRGRYRRRPCACDSISATKAKSYGSTHWRAKQRPGYRGTDTMTVRSL